MSKKNVEQFVRFLLNNKNLNNKQKNEVSRLLVRDTIPINGDAPQNSVPSENKEFYPEYCDTETIFRFLHLFGEKEALKYTTHTWERCAETGAYIFNDFDSFKEQYSAILKKWEKRINILGNTELWMLIRNFLLNDDANYYWGEDKIHVGYNKYLAKWMKDNPNNQPFSMPLSEFPPSIRPGVINKRSLNSFNDIVEIFKRSIEFRDNDLYSAVKRIFKNKSFNINKEKLSSLQGVTFYTHTQKVKYALETIAGNIFNRAEYPEIEISCETIDIQTRIAIRITILQVGSFSNRSIDDPKVIGKDTNGDIATIKNSLCNLCEFSVESIFKQNGKLCPLRINYLTSKENNNPAFEEISKDSCCGFKYILTFYNYNI